MNKYEIIIYWSDEDEAFVAEVPELPGCAARGSTQDEALRNANEAMQLWTHESHKAACALYKEAGWHLESEKPVHYFGQDLNEQHWRYRF